MTYQSISKEALGKYIVQKRNEKGLSREELADKLCVSYDVVWRWETGKRFPDFEMIGRLADELGVTIQELYDSSKVEKDNKVVPIVTTIMIATMLIGAVILGLAHNGFGRREPSIIPAECPTEETIAETFVKDEGSEAVIIEKYNKSNNDLLKGENNEIVVSCNNDNLIDGSWKYMTDEYNIKDYRLASGEDYFKDFVNGKSNTISISYVSEKSGDIIEKLSVYRDSEGKLSFSGTEYDKAIQNGAPIAPTKDIPAFTSIWVIDYNDRQEFFCSYGEADENGEYGGSSLILKKPGIAGPAPSSRSLFSVYKTMN